MARIAGVDIPRDKRVEVALTYIYGIGLPTAKKILAEAKIDGNIRVKDLTEDQVNVIRDIINNNYLVEGEMSLLISNVLWKSAAIAAFATEEVSLLEGRKPKPTLVPAKVPNVLWAENVRNKGRGTDSWQEDKLVEEEKKRILNSA